MTTKRPCGDTRPADRKGEGKGVKPTFKLDDLAEDLGIALTVFPGCIEGDRVTYSVQAEDRVVLLQGTVDQIAHYTVGDKVNVAGADYCRSIGRKQQEAVERIRMEIYGTGDVAALARKADNGQHKGFTVQLNGLRVEPSVLLNGYLRELTFVQGPDGKPTPKALNELEGWTAVTGKEPKDLGEREYIQVNKPGTDQPVRLLGGVEMIVTAIIVSGKDSPLHRVEYQVGRAY